MKSVTHFPDLSAYSYALNGQYDDLVEQPLAVNIGWLGAGHEFPTGQPPEWLVPGLLELIAGGLVNVMRGFHMCHMCENARRSSAEMESGEAELMLGNGEIRVPGADGTLYAAPSLIAHYVAEHSYLPPDGFIEAVREASRT